MRRIVIGMICSGLVFVLSCSKKDTTACTDDACSCPAPNTEVQRVQTFVDSIKINAVKHCSGLFYQIQTEGSGARPTAYSSVTVKYKGSLINGTVFDQSVNPVTFSLVQLIQGWKKGLPVIKKGGRITLIIPPSLGYGPSANGSIPGNSVLIFDIELVSVS